MHVPMDGRCVGVQLASRFCESDSRARDLLTTTSTPHATQTATDQPTGRQLLFRRLHHENALSVGFRTITMKRNFFLSAPYADAMLSRPWMPPANITAPISPRRGSSADSRSGNRLSIGLGILEKSQHNQRTTMKPGRQAREHGDHTDNRPQGSNASKRGNGLQHVHYYTSWLTSSRARPRQNLQPRQAVPGAVPCHEHTARDQNVRRGFNRYSRSRSVR